MAQQITVVQHGRQPRVQQGWTDEVGQRAYCDGLELAPVGATCTFTWVDLFADVGDPAGASAVWTRRQDGSWSLTDYAG